jgi:hypothetical protein
VYVIYTEHISSVFHWKNWKHHRSMIPFRNFSCMDSKATTNWKKSSLFETFLKIESLHFAVAMEKKLSGSACMELREGIRFAVFKFIYQVHKTRTVYSSARWNKSRYKTYTEFKWIYKDTAKLGPTQRLGRSTENVQKQRTPSSVMLLKIVALCFSVVTILPGYTASHPRRS